MYIYWAVCLLVLMEKSLIKSSFVHWTFNNTEEQTFLLLYSKLCGSYTFLSVCVFFFFSKGCWTADDLHTLSGRLHQSAVWQSISGGCTEINVLPGVSDVSVALLAADWSQTSLHPQPAVLPGSHTDQVICWKLFWQNFDRQLGLGRVSWQICQLLEMSSSFFLLCGNNNI